MIPRRCLHPLALILFLLLAAPRLWAQDALIRTIAPPNAGDSAFGRRIAASGSVLVVTSVVSAAPGSGTQRVHIYFHDPGGLYWPEFDQVLQTDADDCEVAVHHSGSSATVVVSETGLDRVWVFERDSTWKTWNSLVLPPGPANSAYGRAVATNGEWIAVGAPLSNNGGGTFGLVELRRRSGSGWTAPTSILGGPSGNGGSSFFGGALAMSAGRLVIGASSWGVNFTGRVDIHQLGSNGTWSPELSIQMNSAPEHQHGWFGSSVAVDGNRVAIGEPRFSLPYPDTGWMHLWEFSPSSGSWSNVSGGGPAAPAANSWYGWTVNLAGNRLLTGTFGPAATVNTDGIVDLYMSSFLPFYHWFVSSTLVPGSLGHPGDLFGRRTALAGKFAFVSAELAGGSGRVYEFVHDTNDCNQNGVPDLAEIELFTLPDCNHDEVPDSCQLASGAFSDCNGNGRLDSCDIAIGWSGDVNADLVPDECQTSSCALAEMNAADGAPNDHLGLSTATDGRRVIAGAPGWSGTGNSVGAAYVYRRDGTTLLHEARLLAPAGHAGDEFGSSCAIFGDVALVGAPGDDERGSSAGAVFVYRRDATTNAWLFETKFFGADTNASDGFGGALELDVEANVLLVGAGGGDTPAGAHRGKVYVFERNHLSWNQRNLLFALNGSDGDAFGSSLDLASGHVAIGAPLERSAGQPASGAVYVGNFASDLSQPVLLSRLARPSPVAGSRLGTSVAMHNQGNLVVAGAVEDPTHGTVAGSAEYWRYNSTTSAWSAGTELVAADTDAWDNFGRSMAWAEDCLIVGSPFKDTSGALGSGALVLFRWWAQAATFVENSRIAPPDANFNQGYGFSLAWRDGLLATGAYADDFPSGTDSGSVYALGVGGRDFRMDGICDLCQIAAGNLPDVNANGIDDEAPDSQPFCIGSGWGTPCPCGNESSSSPSGCRHSFGVGARLTVSGYPRVSANSVALLAERLPSSNPAVTFFQGTTAIEGGVPFADGLICVSGSIVRLATITPQAGVAGAGFGFPGTPDIAVRGQIPPLGGTRVYQAVFRNAANFCTSATQNTTNAWSLLWLP